MNGPCEHCIFNCSNIEDIIAVGCNTILIKQLSTKNIALRTKLKEASEFIQRLGPTIDYPIIAEIKEVLDEQVH